jgi:protein-S-isoprenylcysteine O-methyltransferase Ste14
MGLFFRCTREAASVIFSKSYADRVAKLRVAAGFLLVAVFLWRSDPSLFSLAFGLPLAAAGLALRAWAAGHLEKNRELAQSGPYAHVRNPLYLGTLTVAAGFAAASRRWELAILFAAVFFFVYLPVVDLEEQHLQSLFPSFAEYARRVPRQFPRLSSAGASPHAFRPQTYLKNREYEALVGFLAGTAVLIWKAIS